MVTRKEIDNEAAIISELCRAGGCKNIVEVIRHGWLPRNPLLYYIDMEYCEETLEHRIYGNAQHKFPPAEKTASHATVSQVESVGEGEIFANLANRSLLSDTVFTVEVPQSAVLTEEVPQSEFDWKAVVDIIDDVASALTYIHERGTVHRDLKPRNGTTPTSIQLKSM